MNFNITDKLIEKYFNGETTLQEEKELKTFLFSSNELTEEQKQLKSHFMALDEMASLEPDETLDAKIMDAIAARQQTELNSASAKNKRYSLVYTLSAIAATALILFTIWSTTGLFHGKQSFFQDEKSLLAYRQATDALEILAVNFDKGLSKTSQATKPLNTSLKILGNVEVVNKSMETLRPVEKLANMEIMNKNK
jgi:tetrahydromethanopterin S-methyltransferase subunit B